VTRELQVTSHSARQTEALAEKLADTFSTGDIVVLSGPLGSGKTVFVRGLARGRGISGDLVNSPSFTLVNEYPGKTPIYHFDFYRIKSVDELTEIGLDDYVGRDGLVVIEWGERVSDELPRPHYLVSFAIVGEEHREIAISVVPA
jgi:tRNA threonylcarbamoyladenosine biosynthesis protein TsaE